MVNGRQVYLVLVVVSTINYFIWGWSFCIPNVALVAMVVVVFVVVVIYVVMVKIKKGKTHWHVKIMSFAFLFRLIYIINIKKGCSLQMSFK